MVSEKERYRKIYSELSKKWSLAIIKDLFLGYKTFSEFLEVNEGLTNKVLSDQLKTLEDLGFIKKVIVSTRPVKAIYELTPMGKSLNKLVYEMIMFGLNNHIFTRNHPMISGKNLEEIFDIK